MKKYKWNYIQIKKVMPIYIHISFDVIKAHLSNIFAKALRSNKIVMKISKVKKLLLTY